MMKIKARGYSQPATDRNGKFISNGKRGLQPRELEHKSKPETNPKPRGLQPRESNKALKK
jgi:hypothetical protein